MTNDLLELMSRSSLGGWSWCFTCKHPRDCHVRSPHPICTGSPIDDPCYCRKMIPMTPEQWLAWRQTA